MAFSWRSATAGGGGSWRPTSLHAVADSIVALTLRVRKPPHAEREGYGANDFQGIERSGIWSVYYVHAAPVSSLDPLARVSRLRLPSGDRPSRGAAAGSPGRPHPPD